MLHKLVAVVLIAICGSVGASPSTVTDTLGLPLIKKEHLVYTGAFRFPVLPSTGNICDGWTYGGRALTWNPAGNSGAGSLFATGHNYCGNVGEFSIPALGSPTNLDALNAAQLLQVTSPTPQIVDPLEGNIGFSGVTGSTHTTINGLLVHDGRLVVSIGNDSTTQVPPVSHYTRSINLTTPGVVGPIQITGNRGYSNPRYLSGYMCHLPPALHTTFGFTAFTGWVPQSVVANSSNGPSAFGFLPVFLGGSISTQTAESTLVYPLSAPLQASVEGELQSLWNWTSMTRGCAVPVGTGTLLFVGRHGVGKFGYCVGSSDPTSACYDPTDSTAGEHAFPYVYKVWAYRLADLLAAKAGTIAPETIRPYSTWTVTTPNEDVNGAHGLGGVAYDPVGRRLFVVQENARGNGEPIIHVWTVTNAVSTAVNY